MSDEQLRQHQRMARGDMKMDDVGCCESPFKSGVSHDDGAGRKRAIKDGARSHDGTTRHPDHGPHDMGVPNPRTD
jgi:hypothetical protein